MDLKEIKAVIDLMTRNGLSEFEVEKGDFKLRIKRGPGGEWITTTATAVTPGVHHPAPVAAPPPSAPAAPSADMNELARMASWRMEHLEWNDQTELQLTRFFSTGSLPETATSKPAQKNDTDASAAAAPGAVQ